MQKPTRQELFVVEVTLENGKTREVKVKASVPSVAEVRAVKRITGAVSAKAISWKGKKL